MLKSRSGTQENYLFNSPVGYSKKPLIPPLINSSCQEKNEFHPNEIPKRNRLDTLPFEVRAKIANELSQFDCLNLLRTNKAMYMSTMPRLYQHIVIDENYSQFNKEISFKYYEKTVKNRPDYRKEHSCTFVKSSYNFRRLLTHYILLYETKFKYCEPSNIPTSSFPYIKTLKCLELPDSLNTYDHQLHTNACSQHKIQQLPLGAQFRASRTFRLRADILGFVAETIDFSKHHQLSNPTISELHPASAHY